MVRGTAELLAQVETALSQTEITVDSLVARELIVSIGERFADIRNAYLRTGPGSLPLQDIAQLLQESDAQPLLHETEDICSEIDWRLRELSRTTTLRVAKLPSACQADFASLLQGMQGR